MKKPFKFRYTNEIVGGFVLLVFFLLIAGIIITGRAQGWFEPTYTIRVEFPDEGSMGLRRGAEIRVLDTPAGTVQTIEPRDDGVMEGIFHIRGRFFQYIREDSVGIVKRTFGVAGDSFVEITRGRGAPLPQEDAYIPIIQDTELLDLAEILLNEVRQATVPAIQQFSRLLEEYTGLAQDLRNPEGAAQQMLAGLNRITHDLENGQGTAGKLLRDQDMAQEITTIIERIKNSLNEVNRILIHISESTEKLPRMTDRLSGELDDMPGLVYKTQATLQEAEVLIEGIQRHWLIRKHIDKAPRPVSDRIAPSAIVGAGGDKI